MFVLFSIDMVSFIYNINLSLLLNLIIKRIISTECLKERHLI